MRKSINPFRFAFAKEFRLLSTQQRQRGKRQVGVWVVCMCLSTSNTPCLAFFSTDCSDEQERYSSTYAETERVVNELGKGSGLSLLRFA